MAIFDDDFEPRSIEQMIEDRQAEIDEWCRTPCKHCGKPQGECPCPIELTPASDDLVESDSESD